MTSQREGNSYHQILKYTGLFGGIQGLGILIGIVRNKLVALILGPQGMGLISLFNSTVKLVSDSSNLGIAMSAVRNVSEAYGAGDDEGVRRCVQTVRLWSLLTAAVGMLACLALSPLLDRWTFSWGNHTLHFVMLSPIVALTAITGGETAILKGTRKLGGLATVSILNVVAALLTSVPIYLLLGERGIVPSLLIAALTQMALTIRYSLRHYPYRLSLNRGALADGMDMVRLGIAFVLAGMLGSGADFLIRSFMNRSASLHELGLYNAGYMMTMVYAGMVFSAMETDYFPRLSAVGDDVRLRNQTVNRQIEVSLLLISPMLVLFVVGLPVIIPMLYSTQFMPAIGMVQVMSVALYFRALKLPLSYMPLARGDSRAYLFLEAVYDVAIVVAVVGMFNRGGLTGAGVAFTLTGVFDYLVIITFVSLRYRYRVSREVLLYSAVQVPVGLLAYFFSTHAAGWAYWGGGAVLFLASGAFSLVVLHKKTSLWNRLKERLIRKKE